MPIMEVVLQQTYFNQECVNRWNFIASGTPAAVSYSFALVSALGAIYDTIAVPPAYPPTKLMRLIAGIQSSAVTFDFISARDMYSVTDFYETPFIQPLIGGQAGEGLPPFNAVGYRTSRVRTDIRRGSKRFVGVPENQVGSGGTYTGAYITLLNGLATAMTQPFTYDDEGNTITFQSCILGRERYLPDPLKPDKPAYRPYDTEEEQMEHVATSITWDRYDQVRSQTSRQYGRGR